jgi:uncharacterized protein (DUF362 family)
VHGILCFISSLLSPGKAGSAFAESAFLLFPLDGPVNFFDNGTAMHRKIVVCLQKCNSYNRQILKDFFEECLQTTSNLSLRSAKVFLKPNLLSARGGLACTHPEFLLALAELFVEYGAHVTVGDSPAFGKAASVLRALKVDGHLQRRGVAIVDFETVNRIRLGCGVNIGIAAETQLCDYFINIPKLKAHNQMYVTLAVKNIFGIVQGVRKSMLHMQYGNAPSLFSAIILDLLDLLPPHFSFLDGIVAMNNQGPVHGSPLHFGCIAFSQDAVALDTAVLLALRLSPEKSPLWREAQKRRYPGTVPDNLFFPMLRPEAFHGISFSPPSELSPIRFNPFRFMWNNVKRTVIRIKE